MQFIAELGKRSVVGEKVLHDCARELLSGKIGMSKERKAREQLHTDLECFCQFMKGVGQFMDTPKAQKLMDQYFERLRRILSRCSTHSTPQKALNNHLKAGAALNGDGRQTPETDMTALPARIRFMVEDMLDLRTNNWIPRYTGQRGEVNKPRDIRMKIFRASGTLVDPTRSRDISGSAGANHLSTNKSSLFLGLLSQSTKKKHASHDRGVANTLCWQEVTRLGEELCRSSTNDPDLSGFASRSRHANGGGNGSTSYSRNNNSTGSWNGKTKAGGSSKTTDDRYMRANPTTAPSKFDGHSDSSGWVRGFVGPPRRANPGSSTQASNSHTTTQAAEQFQKDGDTESWSGSSSGEKPSNLKILSKQLPAIAIRELPVAPNHEKRSPLLTESARDKSTELNSVVREARASSDELVNIFASSADSGALIARLSSLSLKKELLDGETLSTCFLQLFEKDSLSPSVSIDAPDLVAVILACASLSQSTVSPPEGIRLVEHYSPVLSALIGLLERPPSSSSSAGLNKTKLASLLALLVWKGHLEISDLVEPFRLGRHHPMFLLVLQRLTQLAGGVCPSVEETGSSSNCGTLSQICSSFDTLEYRRGALHRYLEVKDVRLSEMLPDCCCQSDESLLEMLEERDLAFLVPELRLARELSQLALSSLPFGVDDCDEEKNQDASSQTVLAETLTACVERFATQLCDRQSRGFVHAIMSTVYTYVYCAGTELGPSTSLKRLMTREQAAWRRLLPMPALKEALCAAPLRQLDALHSLQVFWFSREMPKGFILRCFMNLYEYDLVDETTFLTWKEELNPKFPAKGQALFEVNKWLTWLETAEEEEDESEAESTSSSQDSMGTVADVQPASQSLPILDEIEDRRGFN